MAIEHFESFSIVSDAVDIKVDMSRINGNLDKAQFWLDNQIMTDMLPYMPIDTGMLRDVTQIQSRALAGTGIVIAAAAPYGRFQYMGKVMVDPVTNSPWARKGAKKVVTDRPLKYSNPEATPQWFETAKQNNLTSWVNGVQSRV